MSSVWCSLQESALSFVKFCVHLDKHLFFFGGGTGIIFLGLSHPYELIF